MNEVIEKYKNGKTLTQLAREYECTIDTIRYRLKKEGVYQKTKQAICDDLDEIAICEMYKNDVQINDIATAFNVSVVPIKRILKTHNIMKPLWLRSTNYKGSHILLNKSELQALYDTPMSKQELASYLNCTMDVLDSAFKRHALKFRNSGMTRSLKNQSKTDFDFNKETCIELYINQHQSLNDVAKHVGVSTGYLRMMFKEWGVQKRECWETRLSKEFVDVMDDKEMLEKLYHNNHSLRELSNLLQCSVETLTNTLKKHNITLRTLSESIALSYQHDLETTLTEYTINNIHEITVDLVHNNCGRSFTVQKQIIGRYKNNGMENKLCPFCFNRYKTSIEEDDVFQFISTIYSGEIIRFDRLLLKNRELDIVIPELKLAIEYCGLYYHSEEMGKSRSYHQEKTIRLQELGYKLITLFSDEWYNKTEIVKNRLQYVLNQTQNTVYARNCVVKEISTKEKNSFLEKNHIQGKDKSKIKLGLFFNDELVSVMTFSLASIAKGRTPTPNIWELNRFSSSINTNVVGGGSKLLAYFKNNFVWCEIFSFADLRWSTGNIYKQLGFTFDKITEPNYWYMTKRCLERLHRFNFRKHNLIKQGYDKNKSEKEIMSELGYLRIWDCGSARYVLKNGE